MVENIVKQKSNNYRIIVLTDRQELIDSLNLLFKPLEYSITEAPNLLTSIDLIDKDNFDLMILDYTKDPILGNAMIEKLRRINRKIYLLLLTGSNSILPIKAIENLEIQGYCDENDKFNQLILVKSAISSIQQMHIIRQLNENFKDDIAMLENACLEAIGNLRYTIEAQETYMRGHSDRVSKYSLLIGNKMNLSQEDMHDLKIGSLFHDIGKVGVPDRVLLKKTRLDDVEYAQIKNHPSIGANMLEGTEVFKNILPIIKYHHERFDGKGYPSGLKNTDIPLLVRIISIADTFDAMTSKRIYRPALSLTTATEEIQKCSGTQFDPNITEVFLDILHNNPSKIESIQKIIYQ